LKTSTKSDAGAVMLRKRLKV